MNYPEGNGLVNQPGNVGSRHQQYTIRQAYEDGGLKAGLSLGVRTLYGVLARRKAAGEGAVRLARVLSALDLTALGVGSTLGVGVYVLAGDVAKNYAGPAVIISFLLAAVASVFAGLCYAEFGARVPKAGSAYVYSYVCVGEFIAFIIGWNLILEYVIGAASVVKALSEYVDSLLGRAISDALHDAMPLDSPHLASYPDLLAFAVILAFSVALSFGVKESTKFNNFCTGVNLCVVLFVIISGLFKADTANWRLSAAQVPAGAGRGGFAPHGLAGIVRGAAVCFYGFIGFDCVATAGEEAREPQKSIPVAVVFSLLTVFLAYFGVSTVLTLMLPYYLQDEKAPLPFVYDKLGWPWAKYAVSLGAVCALCSSLLGAVYPLPRIVYAMSSDGLLFRCLGRVSARFQTPVLGTLLAGLLTGSLAMLFRLEQLIHMMSIGTLLAYSMVAACVLILRYESNPRRRGVEPVRVTLRAVLRRLGPEQPLPVAHHLRVANPLTATLVSGLVPLLAVSSVLLMWLVQHQLAAALAGAPGSALALLAAAALVIATLVSIARQPQCLRRLPFAVPLVPWLPGASILINVYLMMNLDLMTWIRFGVWMAAGLLIYVTYGVWHSSERRRPAAPHSDSHIALLQHAQHAHGDVARS